MNKRFHTPVSHGVRKLPIPRVERKDNPEIIVRSNGINASVGHPLFRELSSPSTFE
jgi:hypothetical protein